MGPEPPVTAGSQRAQHPGHTRAPEEDSVWREGPPQRAVGGFRHRPPRDSAAARGAHSCVTHSL